MAVSKQGPGGSRTKLIKLLLTRAVPLQPIQGGWPHASLHKMGRVHQWAVLALELLETGKALCDASLCFPEATSPVKTIHDTQVFGISNQGQTLLRRAPGDWLTAPEVAKGFGRGPAERLFPVDGQLKASAELDCVLEQVLQGFLASGEPRQIVHKSPRPGLWRHGSCNERPADSNLGNYAQRVAFRHPCG